MVFEKGENCVTWCEDSLLAPGLEFSLVCGLGLGLNLLDLWLAAFEDLLLLEWAERDSEMATEVLRSRLRWMRLRSFSLSLLTSF